MELRPGEWTERQPNVGLSADGEQWWDGRRWSPTLSPNRKWRFDGHGWLPVPQKPRRKFFDVPRWVKVGGAAWSSAVLLFMATPLATSLGGGSNAVWLLCAFVVMIAVTMVWSFLLARLRLVLWAVLVASVLSVAMLVYYQGAMITQSPYVEGEDDAVVMGLVIIGIPLVAALWMLIAACFGLGLLSRWVIRPRDGR